MKVVQINTFPFKATGTIMMNIHNLMSSMDIVSYVVWGRGRSTETEFEISIEDNIGIKLHGIFTRLTDKTGFASKKSTKALVKQLELIKPDIVHLHNIHGYYVNVDILFNYLKENKIKVVWTFHDCWPFTGHCTYFDQINCKKWINGCNECPQLRSYPTSLFLDNSNYNWRMKKSIFTSVDLTIVTPSIWLKKIVEKSYFNSFPINVINNGIDLNLFKPQKSKFRELYNLDGKFIILGVASEWTNRKGLKDFIELEKMLDERFKIVLVGLNKKQMKSITSNIIAIPRTNDINELISMYSEANIFFNPSIEETMGMTTVEAMACGTLPIVYNATALPEILDNCPELIVEKHNLKTVFDKIIDIYQNGYNPIKYVELATKYDKNRCFMQYIELYKDILGDKSI